VSRVLADVRSAESCSWLRLMLDGSRVAQSRPTDTLRYRHLLTYRSLIKSCLPPLAPILSLAVKMRPEFLGSDPAGGNPTFGPNGLGNVKLNQYQRQHEVQRLAGVLQTRYSHGLETQVSYTFSSA